MADREWVVASSNPGKIRELDALLGPLGIQLRTQRSLGIEDADEPFDTFVENALAKARHASRGSGLPGLADDSGICVPVLGGAPGVRSARYGADVSGTEPAADREAADALNNRCLIEATRRFDQPVACFYYCVIVLVHAPDDPCPLIAEGAWHGVLASAATGAHGFGYDPWFLPNGESISAAAMAPEVKNRVSHRSRAIAGLVDALRRHGLA